MAHFGIHAQEAYKYKLKRSSAIVIDIARQDSTSLIEPDMYSSVSERSDSIVSDHNTYNEKIYQLKEKTKKLKQETSETLKTYLKLLDSILILLAMSGLAAGVYDFEANYNERNSVIPISIYSAPRILLFISLSTLICIIFSVLRSIISYKLNRELKFFLKDKTPGYFKSTSFQSLLLDILILLPHPQPFIDKQLELSQLNGILYINLNSVLLSIMIARLLLLFRLFLHYSKWSDLKVQQVCRTCNVDNPLQFALKSCLQDMPHLLLIPAFVISTVALGVALQIYERSYNNHNTIFSDGGSQLNYTYLYNAEWLILLTMTTVGFGDFFARTHVGRSISILAAIWGTFIISLMIIMINKYVSFTRPQEKSYKYFHKLSDYRSLKSSAGAFIKSAIQLYMYKRFRKLPESDAAFQLKNSQMLRYKQIYRLKVYEAKFRNNDIRDILSDLNGSFSYDLERMQRMVAKAKDMDAQLDVILESQRRTFEILTTCFKFSKDIKQLLAFAQIDK